MAQDLLGVEIFSTGTFTPGGAAKGQKVTPVLVGKMRNDYGKLWEIQQDSQQKRRMGIALVLVWWTLRPHVEVDR